MKRPTFSIALLSALSYLLALTLWCGAWWFNYVPTLDIKLSDGDTLVVMIIGFALLVFAKRMCETAGQTPGQFMIIVPCALIGFGAWILGLVQPPSLFASSITGGQSFSLFLIGLFAITAAGHASRRLAGEAEEA